MENKNKINNNEQNIVVRRKPSIKLVIFLAFFCLLVILDGVLIYFASKNEKAAQGADTIIKLSAQGGFECDYAEAQKLYPFDEGVMKVTYDRIAYLTLSGNEIFSYTVDYQNPFCVVENGYAAVLDINGYSFSVFSKEGRILNVSTEDKVKSISMSSSGLCAVIVDKDDAYGQVVIYDNNGKVFGQWISYNSGYPISLTFSDNSDYLAISVVNTSGASIESSVKLIKINYENNKYEAIDYAVYEIEDSVIVTSLQFTDNNNLYAFSTDCYYVIDQSGSITKTVLDNSVINFKATVGNRLFIIYSDGIAQLNKLKILKSDNSSIYDSDLGRTIFAFSTSNDNFVVSTDRRVFVYDSEGNIISDSEVDEDIIRLGLIGKNRIVVVSTNGVHTINY